MHTLIILRLMSQEVTENLALKHLLNVPLLVHIEGEGIIVG